MACCIPGFDGDRNLPVDPLQVEAWLEESGGRTPGGGGVHTFNKNVFEEYEDYSDEDI